MEADNVPSNKRRKLSHSSEASEASINTNNESEQNSSPAGFHEDDVSESDHEDYQQRHSITKPEQLNEPLPGHDLVSSDTNLLVAGTNKWQTLTVLTNELLSQTRLKSNAGISRGEAFVRQITKALQNASGRPPMSVTKAEDSLRKAYGIAIPFANPRPGPDTKYLFEFKPPVDIKTVGSSASQTLLKGPRTLDLCVLMPPEMFQKKDYLNHRALHKRAHYTACVAAVLKTYFADKVTLVYDYQDSIDLLPAVILTATEQSLHTLGKLPIRIIVGLPPAVIPGAKYTPDKNCVRLGDEHSTDSKVHPTPFYNACLQVTTSIHLVCDHIYAAKQRCHGFGEACALGRIWLQQRNLGSSVPSGGLGSFEWTTICMALLEGGGHKGKPLFSINYSALNLFRATLQFLATKDLTDPFVVGKAELSLENTDVPMFYYAGASADYSMNVLFKMTAWSYQSLRYEAKKSVDALSFHSEEATFDSLFIHRSAAPILRYHESISVEVPSKDIEKGKELGVSGNPFLARLHQAIQRGLSDRVELIQLETPPTPSFKLTKGNPSFGSTVVVSIRLLLKLDQADRLVDRGPFQGDKDEEEFQRFWGPKSELRRFKDNAVARESLLWSEQCSIRLQIISHILSHHFGIGESVIKQLNTDLEHTLPSSTFSKTANNSALVNKEFQTLTQILLNLTSLPLRIHTVQPASVYLGGTSLQPPTTLTSSSPINIVITFESSPNWPDSLSAIQYTKLAFLIKIADSIDTEHQSLKLTTRVGIENENTSSPGYLNTSYLDIVFSSARPGSLLSVLFRVRIQHEREEHLLRIAQTDKSVHGATRDTLESVIQLHKRNVLMPIHTVAIRELCNHFVTLSPTIRLLKKWTASHLLSSLIPDQVIETIAASIFTESSPLDPGPLSFTFVKCLNTLARWEWQTDPLFINLKISEPTSTHNDNLTEGIVPQLLPNSKITADQKREFFQKFKAWRDIDPVHHRVAACIFTSIDPTGITWTQIPKDPTLFFSPNTSSNADHNPTPAGLSPLALNRWQQLAKASVHAIETKAVADTITSTDWQPIFITPTSHYDFLLHFDRHLVVDSGTETATQLFNNHNNAAAKFKNLQLAPHLDRPREFLSFDPITLYLADLQRSFHRACILFYGSGSLLAGGLWQQNANRKQPFRVRAGVNLRPRFRSDDDEKKEGEEEISMELNRDVMLSEMARMGQGIVKRVEVLR